MEREFLKNLDLGNGARLSKDVIDAIMAEHGKTVNPLLKQVNDLIKERDGLKERAEAAEAIVQKIPKDQDPAKLLEALEKAQKDLTDAKTDYDTRLAERDFDDALKAALEDVKFTSEAARRDVAGQVRAAGLKLVNGKIMGLGDLLGQIREKDASAFVDEKQEELENGKARFTQPTGDGGKGGEPMTREKIMAITDRAARRRAIAENIDIF